MTAKVVSLNGAVPIGLPVPNVVDKLEELLEKARSGNLTAFAYVTVTTGNIAGQGWEQEDGIDGGAATNATHALGNGILCLMHRFGAASA